MAIGKTILVAMSLRLACCLVLSEEDTCFEQSVDFFVNWYLAINSCMSIDGLPTNWWSLVAHYLLLYCCLGVPTLLLLLLRCSSYEVVSRVIEELVDR
jgi:hypothetical protein